MSLKVVGLEPRVIDLQLELRKLEAKWRKLRRRIDSEPDRLLGAKETMKRSRRIDV